MTLPPRWAGWIASVSLVALGVLTWLAVHAGPRPQASAGIVGWLALLWIVFAIGAFAVMRSPRKLAVGLILAGGIGLQVIAATTPPQTSTDYYRYAWDGRVQASGVSPYQYAPIDPALSGLRDPWLFPPGRSCPEVGVPSDCPLINRPTVKTIYPPVAQLYFLAVNDLSPANAEGLPLQIAAALMGVMVTALLLVIARSRGVDPRRAVLWSWCPLVVIELGNNAHVDGLSAVLVVSAMGLLASATLPRLRSRNAIGGGVALGVATAAKLLPIVLLPSVVKRRPVAVVLAFVTSIAIVYLPYVWSQGLAVFGFLGGYVSEESSGQFAVIKLVLPDDWAPPIAVLLLFALALWALWRSDPLHPWLAGAATVGCLFLIVTPPYQWYALLLVPLVALGARASWLVLPIAMTFAYFEPDFEFGLAERGLAFLAGGLIVAGFAMFDYFRKARARPAKGVIIFEDAGALS